jgi:hypothetical protein
VRFRRHSSLDRFIDLTRQEYKDDGAEDCDCSRSCQRFVLKQMVSGLQSYIYLVAVQMRMYLVNMDRGR